MAALQQVQETVGFKGLLYDDHVGKVSLIGAGMRSHPGVAASSSRRSPTAGVNIEMISTSEIRVSVVCRDTDLDAAVRAVHDAFELGGDDEAVVYAGTGTVSAPMAPLPTLAVVGATGAVGTVMCDLLRARKNVWGEIRLLASAALGRPAVRCRGEELTVQALTAGGLRRRRRGDVRRPRRGLRAVGAGRRRPRRGRRSTTPAPSGWTRDVPLVVPEINPEQVRNRPQGIIANPNCTTLSMIVAIGPLHREYGLRELVVASYQAASGAGQAGVDTLHDQLAKVAGDRALGSRAGDVRQAVGDDAGPVPGAAGAQRGAVGRLAAGRRLVVRGAEGPQRVPQDPRPARPEGLRHLRTGAGGDRPLGRRARGLRHRGGRRGRPRGAAQRARA